MTVLDSDQMESPPCQCGAPSATLIFLGRVHRSNFMIQCPKCHGLWWIRGLEETPNPGTEVLSSEITQLASEPE
jgi:hypothetical protein